MPPPKTVNESPFHLQLTCPACPRPSPPFSARVPRPSGGGQGGWGFLQSDLPINIPPATFPLSSAHPRRPMDPQPHLTAANINSGAPQLTTPVFDRPVCVSSIDSPSSTSYRSYSTPNLPPSAHFTPPSPPQHPLPIAVSAHGNLYPVIRFEHALHSPLARIHLIPFTFSPGPKSQAPSRCAYRGTCDRMIANPTERLW